jgi:hypothetical protein
MATHVCLTVEEFEVVYAALQMANTSYTEDDVPELVAREATAWATVEAVRHRADLPDVPRSSGAFPTS